MRIGAAYKWCPSRRGDLSESPEKLSIFPGGVKGEIADDHPPGKGPGCLNGLLDQALEEHRLVQVLGGHECVLELRLGNIEQLQLQILASLQTSYQQVKAPPERLQTLKVRVVKESAHLMARRSVNGIH